MVYDLRSRVTFQLWENRNWEASLAICAFGLLAAWRPGSRLHLLPRSSKIFQDLPRSSKIFRASGTRARCTMTRQSPLCRGGTGPVSSAMSCSCQTAGVHHIDHNESTTVTTEACSTLRSPDDASEACDSYLEADRRTVRQSPHYFYLCSSICEDRG